ncbi:MAG: GPI inositol-deacylase [Actinomycetota bacterium]|nr:GPI inositol-deacylase [Actinomycetota bacterium]
MTAREVPPSEVPAREEPHPAAREVPGPPANEPDMLRHPATARDVIGHPATARDVPRALRQLGKAALRVRAPWAHTAFLRSDVLAGRGVPRGDGAPVVLLPPAVAGDWLLPILSNWLRRIGYVPYPSTIALHIDCSDRTMTRLLPRVEALAQRSQRRVVLLGHSRGGLLSRALAGARPDLVERVVTLASPLADPYVIQNLTLAAAASLARSRMQRHGRVDCLTAACACPYGAAFASPWPTGPDAPRLVSLFTRSDEVVRWQTCLVPYAHNVEVRGSHTGLLASRNAYQVIAEALAGRYDEPGTTWCGEPPSYVLEPDEEP